MSAETIGVVLTAVGTTAGVVIGYLVKAKVRLRKTDAELAERAESVRIEREIAEESRVVAELSRHIERLTADGNFLRDQVDRLRKDCDEREGELRARIDLLEEEIRQRADAKDRELGILRGEFERLRVWVEYLQARLRERRVPFREYTPGKPPGSGSDTHQALPPDQSPGS